MTRTKRRKHPLSGHGPIVDRARQALRFVAAQFGDVQKISQTNVTVRTHDDIEVTLSYAPGNYIFSRVYNLTVAVALPASSAAPTDVKLSHWERGGVRYRSVAGGEPSRAVRQLNEKAEPLIAGIDLHASTITTEKGVRTLTVTPLGGSYVWVLIPPVFKSTTFPAGEPDRILALIRAIRDLEPVGTVSTKGPAT